MYVTEWKQISKVIEQMELLSCEKKIYTMLGFSIQASKCT